LQDGVTEKFQPLIVEVESCAFERETRMGKSLGQEERVAELVADVPLERVHVGRELRGTEIGSG
jgi:hypothetical protein